MNSSLKKMANCLHRSLLVLSKSKCALITYWNDLSNKKKESNICRCASKEFFAFEQLIFEIWTHTNYRSNKAGREQKTSQKKNTKWKKNTRDLKWLSGTRVKSELWYMAIMIFWREIICKYASRNIACTRLGTGLCRFFACSFISSKRYM